jgi:hypothetical protein
MIDVNDPHSQSQRAETYRFVVGSVDEALAVLERQLGPNARVLSVRHKDQPIWRRLFRGELLEVVAEVSRPHVVDARPSDSALQSVGESPAVSKADDAAASDFRSTLRNAGFSDRLLLLLEDRFDMSLSDRALSAKDLEAFAGKLGILVKTGAEMKSGARVAFFSDCHHDKSLAISQWISREVFVKGAGCRVCHVEFTRPNPYLDLEVFCQAIGVEMLHYTPEASYASLGQGVCWDIPSVKDHSETDRISKILDENKVGTRVLVQNAAYEIETIRANLRTARRLGVTHLVLTNLNQVRNVAKVWEVLIESELPPLFFSNDSDLLCAAGGNPVDQLIRRTLGKS